MTRRKNISELKAQLLRLPQNKRRYLAASVVLVPATQGAQAVMLYWLGWRPVAAAVATFALLIVPSYLINRRWVWQQEARTKWKSELLPYIATALVGFLFALGTASLLETAEVSVVFHLLGSVSAYLLPWLARLFVCERLFTESSVTAASFEAPAA